MLQVSQSATGQFVVTHPASNTVMVGDELAATYEQMRTFVAGLGDAARADPVPAHSRGPRLGSAAAHWLVLAALALLPFVWLGALHVSLGRLVAELSIAAPAGSKEPSGADLRARVERVERQIEMLARPPTRTPEPLAEQAGPQAEQAEQQAERANDGPDGPADPDKAVAGAGAEAGAAGMGTPGIRLPGKAARKTAEDAGSGPP